MNDSATPSPPEPDLPRSTAPEQFNVCCRGFNDEGDARAIGTAVGEWIRGLGSVFDLSHLDGVTIAYDYTQALVEIDRGYESAHRLASTDDGHAVGVAMTPSVIRSGVLKSHIVLNAAHVESVVDESNDDFLNAVHLIAHECAHVEVNHRYDSAFPGVVLQCTYVDRWKAWRGNTIMCCWDEYAACWLSARYGRDATDDLEEVFVSVLANARHAANTFIKAYRLSHDHERVIDDVYGVYGNLLKMASYHLGNLAGWEIDPKTRPRTVAALEGHWFAPYFERLKVACEGVAVTYGKWTDHSAFDAIADVADAIVVAGGVKLKYGERGLAVDVPLTWNTIP